MALATQDGAAYLWLKGHAVVLTTVVAYDLESRRRAIARRGLF